MNKYKGIAIKIKDPQALLNMPTGDLELAVPLVSVNKEEAEAMYPPLYRFDELTTEGDEEVFKSENI